MLVVSFFFPFLSFISILDVIRSLLIFHSCATVRLPLSQAHSTPVSPDWLFSNWWSARGRGCYGNLRGVLGKGETVVVGRGREGAPTQENGGQHSCEAWVVTSENGLCVCVWHPNYLSLAKAAECVSAQNVLVCVCIQMVGKESRSPLENLLRAPLLESFFFSSHPSSRLLPSQCEPLRPSTLSICVLRWKWGRGAAGGWTPGEWLYVHTELTKSGNCSLFQSNLVLH